MKTIICTLFLLVAYITAVKAQNVLFTDPNFKACLVNDNFVNTNNDSEIQISEATAASSIVCINQNISNVTGIEHFTNLVSIECYNNNALTSIDLSNSTNIGYIEVQNNQLSSLMLPSSNDKLYYLNASGNQISSLNLPSNNDTLKKVYLQNNQLTSLSLPTTLPELDTLDVTNNQLTSLSLGTTYPKLASVFANNNQLSSLDLSNAVDLRDVICNNNQLTSLLLPPLANLSQSILREVSCRNNQLSKLNATPSLLIDCGKNPMDSLWVSGVTNLSFTETLLCDSNQLVYISSNKEIETINCSHNQLESLHNLMNPNSNQLETLNCSYNSLDSLVIGITGLTNFNCSHNQLKKMAINNNFFVSNTFDARNNSDLYCIETPDYLAVRGSWLVDNQTVINDVGQCSGIWSSTTTINNLPAVTLYPNPTTAVTQLDLGQTYESVTVDIYTSVGQLIRQYQITSTDQVTLELPKEKGLYLLMLYTEKGNQSFKVVKE